MDKSRRSANLVSENNIFSDIVHSRVGIGTTVPIGHLHVSRGPIIVGTANSTGTASQNLQITGGAYVSGNLGVGNTNPSYNIHVIATTDPAGLFFDAYGNVAANIAGRRTNGTLSSPTGVTTNNNLLVLQGGGYTTGSAFADAKAAIFMQASEVWTSTAQGTHIDFATTLPGTTTRSNKVRIDGYGNVLVGTSSSTGTASQPLQVTGGGYVSGSVGIGRTNPGVYGLDVNGIARIGSDAGGKLSVGTGMAAGEFGLAIVPYSDRTELQAEQQGTSYRPLVLQPFGSNVGIGTTNPTVALQLSPNASISNLNANIALSSTAGAAATVAQFRHNNGNTSFLRIKATRNSTGSDWTTASTKLVQVIDVTEQGYIEFNPNGANYGLAFGQGSNEYMRILDGGNVGVGVTNPGQKLDVSGSIRASSQLISSVATGTAPLTVSSTTLVSNLNADLLDGLNSSDFVRTGADSSITGKVHISRDGGSECCSGGNYTLSLAENTNVTARSARIQFHNSGVSEGYIGLSTSGSRRMIFADNQSVTMGIECTGSIVAAGNITAYSSDLRLKENLRTIDNPLEKVLQLNGYIFDWNDKINDFEFSPEHKKNDVGLIAQEVQKVLPQAAPIAPFDRDYDKETNELVSKSGENYLTIQYERLVPLLVEAIKEQQDQINKLKEEINNLKK